jgi:hypothetical protein
MRGKYRQTCLRVSADDEETTQSANLKVEMNRTLPVVVEGALFSMASLNQDESHSTARQKSSRGHVLLNNRQL